ncbi:MAG: hypothetical protein L6R42_002212 [Xanthoria sp. 1 TBL-2021]|nr:MAG: hypothetical protein L6R42_002212 [Xanthoria sp. 1 TBL-2021]
MATPEHLALRTKSSTINAMSANTVVNFTEKKPPFHATNLGELAAGVLRHGMTWTIFRPEEGVFLAEGNGHTLRLKLPPSYTFEYTLQPSIEHAVSNSLYVKSPLVDKLFFGILPGDSQLQLPDYHMGTASDVYHTMYTLDPTGKATKKIRDNRHPSFAPKSLFGFSDIIPLAGAMLRGYDPQSTIARLPIPAEYTTGLLSHQEGFVIFRHRLDDFIASPQYTDSPVRPVPDMILAVRDMYYAMMDEFPEWEDEVLANKQINNRSAHFLNRSLEHWVACTEYFRRIHETTGPTFYRDLMASHLKNAVNWWHQAWNRIRTGKERDNHGLRDYIAEGMHLYWDYLELVIEDMESKGWMEVSREMLSEAWVVMIFRGFWWWRCHWMMEGDEMCEAPPRLPSEYYKDKSPIKVSDVDGGFVVVPDGEEDTD